MSVERLETRWELVPFEALNVHRLYALLALRQRVFVVEQDCVYLDSDGDDLTALHLLVWHGEMLVGCLRVLPATDEQPVRIGRVVVAPEARRTGLGAEMMRRGVHVAHEAHGLAPIRIHAQAHLAGWYATVGFTPTGPLFDEDGIPHVVMWC